ncbi:hypothetical protein BDR07DRAFT_1432072 [Suillus spraguei]|nr:hypothetical protein BDR07DRAFT_1432072 [Suillus spraguei]
MHVLIALCTEASTLAQHTSFVESLTQLLAQERRLVQTCSVPAATALNVVSAATLNRTDDGLYTLWDLIQLCDQRNSAGKQNVSVDRISRVRL